MTTSILIHVDGREKIFLRGVPAHLTLRAFANQYEKLHSIRLPLTSVLGGLANLTLESQIIDLQVGVHDGSDVQVLDLRQSSPSNNAPKRGRLVRRAEDKSAAPATKPLPSNSRPIEVRALERDLYRIGFRCSSTGSPFDVLVDAETPPGKLSQHRESTPAKGGVSSPGGSPEVVFLVDTSGSMRDEIDGVKSSCSEFADQILHVNSRLRMALVGFDIGGHTGSATNYTVHDLGTYTIGVWEMADPKSFKDNIANLVLRQFGGVGCHVAGVGTPAVFEHACQSFSEASEGPGLRSMILISDEMGNTKNTERIISTLAENRVTCHVLGCTEEDYRNRYTPGPHQEIANRTGGAFWGIRATKGVQAFTQLLDEVGETIATGLRQRLATSKRSKKGTARARVLRTIPRPAAASRRSVGGAAKSLGENERFDFLTDFSCPHCGEKQREQCPHCGADVCSSSGRDSDVATCPACQGLYIPEDVDAVETRVSAANSGKGDKGK